MKAMIMAAGLGTRLKPWTLHHPKALVPVEGVPVLQRLILKLTEEGFDCIIINVHHFSDQVKDFLKEHDFGIDIAISDETEQLLDTGGALARIAEDFDIAPDEPVLVHNVDILSNQSLSGLMEIHRASGNDVTLLTSDRDSTRRLVFDNDNLCGWHRIDTGQYRPDGFQPAPGMTEQAFSGIYVVNGKALEDIRRYGAAKGPVFPIMDYFLSLPDGIAIRRHSNNQLRLLDIGKPDALKRASEFI